MFNDKARTILTIVARRRALQNPPIRTRLLQVADSTAAPDLRGVIAPGKPIMSTFFKPVPGGCCGMTEEGHANIVAAWRRAWELY